MTDHEAKYILDKHTGLFNLQETNQSIPDASNGSIGEIYSALLHFHPGYQLTWTCGSCVYRMVEDANRKRKELTAKFRTFPKHDEDTNSH